MGMHNPTLHLRIVVCLFSDGLYATFLLCFAILDASQDPSLSPELSFVCSIPNQQANSCPDSCVCPAQRRRPSGLSPLLLIPLLQRSPSPVPSPFPSDLPSLFDALLFGFWPPPTS